MSGVVFYTGGAGGVGGQGGGAYVSSASGGRGSGPDNPIMHLATLARQGKDLRIGGNAVGVVRSLSIDMNHEDRSLDDETHIARVVLESTIDECRDPDPSWAPDAVQARLVKALKLAWEIEAVENFRHDLELTGHKLTMRDVYDRWEHDFEGRGSPGPGPRAFGVRFNEHFNRMRGFTRELRALLTRAALADGDLVLAEEVVSAAFSAALQLEAHYETTAHLQP